VYGVLSRREAPPADAGFTLVELVVSTGILGVVSAGLAGVMIAAFAANGETAVRLTESRDIQFVTAYVADDVQGATSVLTGVTARCGTGTAVLELRGASYDPASLDAQVTVVSYVLSVRTVDGVTSGSLHRLACAVPTSPAPSYPLTPASDTVVARTLAATAPAVTCSPTPCSAATTSVSLALAPASGGSAVTVGGVRRTTP
jgi:prepilin-type N-terminal cleavage/methylation domain-containing protein